MVVNSSKKTKRLSWEMSEKGSIEGSGVSVSVGGIEGVEDFVGIEVGGIDVGAVEQAERTRLDTNRREKIQACRRITSSWLSIIQG